MSFSEAMEKVNGLQCLIAPPQRPLEARRFRSILLRWARSCQSSSRLYNSSEQERGLLQSRPSDEFKQNDWDPLKVGLADSA